MRYHALATDYDGTIAHHGDVSPKTFDALRRLKQSGRKVILVTGRELPDLLQVFPQLEIFDRVVAENGALIFRPQTKEQRPLAEAASQPLLELLRKRGVNPLSVGRVIIATNEPNESVVLEGIRELGLELQVIFNKGAVMILPSGVNKATGLSAALKELGLSARNVVGIGDAENDHAFLTYCECSAAVDNALPALKERADIVTQLGRGDGVRELIAQMLADDLQKFEPRLSRHEILLGTDESGRQFRVKPYGGNLLVAGGSGAGKSTLVTGFVEAALDKCYQACVVDPEGDYAELEQAVVLGDSKRPPGVESVIQALDQPEANVVVSLVGIKGDDRPAFFQRLFPELMGLRARTGRPHWIIIDEAHHVVPAPWRPSDHVLPAELMNLVFVTVHPRHLAAPILQGVSLLVTSGEAAAETIAEFCAATDRPRPQLPTERIEDGQALGWCTHESTAQPFVPIQPKTVRRRHRRKYATGQLPPERSYYFRGPENKLNLRAQNLQLFMQLADGVDDETWAFHLQRGEYSDWLRHQLKDDELAEAVAEIERDRDLSARDSRARVRARIEERYTVPA